MATDKMKDLPDFEPYHGPLTEQPNPAPTTSPLPQGASSYDALPDFEPIPDESLPDFEPFDDGSKDATGWDLFKESMLAPITNNPIITAGIAGIRHLLGDKEQKVLTAGGNIQHAVADTASSIPVMLAQLGDQFYSPADEAMSKVTKTEYVPRVESALKIRQRIMDLYPSREGDLVTETLAKGVGYLGAFAATGGYFGTAGVMTTGAAVGGAHGMEDALAHNADPDQVQVAYWLNSTLGTLEALPVMRAFDRFDELSGGVFSGAVKKYLSQKGGEVLTMGTKGAIEEAAQEFVQGLGANVIASGFAGYDPDRAWSDNLAAAVAEGGFSGFLLSAALASVGVRLRQPKLEELQAQLDEERKKADVASNVEGDFTPIRQVMGYWVPDTEESRAIEKQLQNAEQKLQTAVRKELGKKWDRVKGGEANLEMTGSPAPQLSPHAYWREETARHVINLIRDKVRARDAEGNPIEVASIAEQFEKAGTAYHHSLSPELLTMENYYELTRREIMEMDHGTVTKLKEAFERRKAIIEASIRQLEKWRAQYLPDVKIMLVPKEFIAELNDSAGRPVVQEPGEGNLGYAARFKYEGQEYAIIGMDFKSKTMTKEDFATVLAHEFGHNIASLVLSKADMRVQQAMLKEYWRWLERQVDRPLMISARDLLQRNRWDDIAALGKAQQARDYMNYYPHGTENAAPITPVSAIPENYRHYLYSFDEFMAETIAKMFVGRPRVTAQSEKSDGPTGWDSFFEDTIKSLRAFYNGMKGVKGMGLFHSKKPVFESWLKALSLRGQFELRLEEIRSAADVHNRITAISKLGWKPGIDFERFGQDFDNFDRFQKLLLNLSQIAKANPHLQALQSYVNEVRLHHRDRINFIADAQNTITLWNQLSKAENAALSKVLYEETLNEREYSPEELELRGISEKSYAVYKLIKKNFSEVLNRIEAALVDHARRTWAHDPVAMQTAINELQNDFEEIRSKPYFPLTRFGKYTVEVRAAEDMELDGKKYKKGQLIALTTAETQSERKGLLKEAKRDYAGSRFIISQDKLTDTHMAFQSMPPALLRAMKDKLNLDPKQQAIFDKILEDAHPAQSFRKHFKKRRGLEGYSLDAQRAFASYMFGAAGHLGRVEHGDAMLRFIKEIEDSAKEIARLQGGDATKRRMIGEYMREHYDYLMNPVNEWAGMRQLGFLWYLGFNVKSAAVNLTQIPLVTYPYLAGLYGDAEATTALAKATKDAALYFIKPEKLKQEVRDIIAKGMRDGWLDESLASTLAAVAEDGNLDRAFVIGAYQKAKHNIVKGSSYLFHIAEKMNRVITAIAAAELAMAQGKSGSQAYFAARDAVETTQFEYARWNRPELFRGKKSVVFLFMNYVQNALHFAFSGNPGTTRFWYMLLVMAGVQGLPFAEDILNMLDGIGTYIKEKAGWKNPKVDSRLALREFAEQLDMNPDLLLHGLSRKTMGMGFVAEMLGVKIPEIDLSASLSMGNILPFDELVVEQDFERAITSGLERGGGALVSGGLTMLQALYDDNPNATKRYEAFFPVFARSVSKAYRHYEHGEVSRSGAVIADFDPSDPVDLATVAAEGLGFTPTRVSEGWELYITQRQHAAYYLGRRSALLAQYDHAKEMGDREAVADVRAAIKKYNSQVPSWRLKITFADLAKSRRQRDRVRRKLNRGDAPQKMADPIFRQVEEAFNPRPQEPQE